jgi:hypothetical protein
MEGCAKVLDARKSERLDCRSTIKRLLIGLYTEKMCHPRDIELAHISSFLIDKRARKKKAVRSGRRWVYITLLRNGCLGFVPLKVPPYPSKLEEETYTLTKEDEYCPCDGW